jgi:hypothetical protein
MSNRSELDDEVDSALEEFNFLERLLPWSKFLNQQTKLKAQWIRRIPFDGIFPSIAVADILIQTDFGKHPVSKEAFRGRQSNNLALLEVDRIWEGDRTKYLGTTYKMFENWQSFYIHWSDLLVFRSPLIFTKSYDEQIEVISKDRLIGYNETMLTLIQKYDLTEFDNGIEKPAAIEQRLT